MATVTLEQLSPEIQLLRVIGRWEYADIIETIKKYGPEIRHHLIWDFAKAAVVDLNVGQLQGLMPIIKAHSSIRQAGSKTASVASREFAYALMDMYASFAKQSGLSYQYKAFDTMEEVLEWIQSK